MPPSKTASRVRPREPTRVRADEGLAVTGRESMQAAEGKREQKGG